MAEKTRKTVQAVMEETTEGTPVAPAGVSSYIPLQDGFTIVPNFAELENNELQDSIGQSKRILGLEAPVVTTDNYVKHSGVEGTAPHSALYYKNAFGDVDISGTEYDLVAGSSASVVNVDAAEGATFQRGQAMLFKDSVNGYGIRNVLSIATDAITLNSALAGAPAAGVNTGKAVLYLPGEDHNSLDFWNYRGNGGAIELVSGGRCTDFSINFPAGDLINSSLSFLGNEYYFNPVFVDTTNDSIDFDDAGGEENVVVASKTYKDPKELADAIATAMNGATTDTITCVYSNSTGKFTIASDGGTLSLLWKTGAQGSDNTGNTIGATIGFVETSDDTGATSYAADAALDLASPYTPTFDSENPLVAKSNEIRFGDDTSCMNASNVSMNMTNTATDNLDICADSAKSGAIIGERLVVVEIQGTYSKYDADKFNRFKEGTATQFMYNAGRKSGGNWVAGSCVNIWLPTATITSLELVDNDGKVDISMTLTAYVSSGLDEVYLNFI